MSRSQLAVGVAAASLCAVGLAGVSSAASSTKYTASLSGAQEVPKVASKATATATITVTGNKLCYVISSKNLGEVPQAAHIHSGRKGKAGPVFVTLLGTSKPLRKQKLSGCVVTTASKLKAIKATPSAYYVNVHTKKYPSGSLRGQLKKR